jgi:hypothetical protein
LLIRNLQLLLYCCFLACIPQTPTVNDIPNKQGQQLHKRDEHPSSDGQWRSFSEVPNLLQYVSNEEYYGRIKVSGKVIRESFQTTQRPSLPCLALVVAVCFQQLRALPRDRMFSRTTDRSHW